MAKIDIEVVLDQIITYVKANIAAKFIEIGADKADGITLKPLDGNAYFFQTLNNEITNFDPFFFYGIEGVQSEGKGPYTSKKYTLTFVIVVADQGTDKLIAKRVLRYNRALSELFEEGWDKMCDGVKLEVENLAPIDFKTIFSPDECRAVGVSVMACLG